MLPIKVFAAHNWGPEGANHRRVAKVVAGLQSRGVSVWFDENDMKGNMLTAMCHGIDSSAVVLLFVTNEYMNKVEHGGDLDNVRREFMYAARTPEKLIPIRFEVNLPRLWSGPLGMVLGSHLYCDMSKGEDVTEEQMDNLLRMIDSRVRGCEGRTVRPRWRDAARKTATFAAPLATEKDDTPLRIVGKGMLTVKKRVQRVVDLYGSLDASAIHTREVVDRLFVSIVGEGNEGLGLLEKLRLVEEELGVAT